MFAVLEWMPVWLHFHADLQLLGRAVDHAGDDVDTDIECHAGNGIGLGALKRRWSTMRNCEGEYRAPAGHLAPFDVAAPAGKDAHRARKMLILLCRLAVLDHELLLPRRFPERHAKIVMPDVTPDLE